MVDDGASPALSVSRLCRFYRAVCLRNGLAHHQTAGEAWIYTTRRWAILTWLFQSTGILLGMGWAYTVLGWSGYSGWDPVENASLLPRLTATAFLHSVMMQEKKGMMKVWNMGVVSATFLLSILGT